VGRELSRELPILRPQALCLSHQHTLTIIHVPDSFRTQRSSSTSFLDRVRHSFEGSVSAKMPTPESALFLAKKPTVPPTFDGVDFDDNVAVSKARDAIIREQWVKVMMARLVREEMGKCYAKEGVNHLEKCGRYRGEWFSDNDGV